MQGIILAIFLFFACPALSSQFDSFKCANSDQTIHVSAVNDDYCDCADGSDEPATSACSKHGGMFLCKNEKHKPVSIPSSRAFDGVCDCCDASDEAPGVCKDVCHIAAEEENKVLRAAIADQEQGVEAMIKARNNYYQQVELKLKEKETAGARKAEAQTELDLAEKELQRTKDSIAALEEIIKLAMIDEVNKEADAFLVERKAEDEKKRIEEEEMKKQEEEQKKQDETLSVDPPPEDGEHHHHPHQPSPATSTESAEEKEARYLKERTEKFDSLMRTKFNDNGPHQELEKVSNEIDGKISEIKERIRDFENKQNDIDQFLKNDIGPNKQFADLIDHSFEFTEREYVYKVSPFKDALQGYTNVGSWHGFNKEYTQLQFTGGTRCWGGPDRSLSVDLFCGAKTEILEVKEPNKCEYLMKMKTPGACSEQKLAELKAQLR